MGTIGVANLSNASAAAKAGKATGTDNFVSPLNSQNGPASKLNQGTGIVQAKFKGHYLILIWAEFADLKAPSTSAQRAQLGKFYSDLVNGTANIALTNRMVTGKP
jgi:hypothetical protein